MNQEKPQWGTAAWFAARFVEEGTNSPTAYFSYGSNGYQRYRHRRLLGIVSKNREMIGERARLVDVGCATGVLTHGIGETIAAGEMTGVDFSHELLESGRENFPAIRFVHGGLPQIPLEGESADLLTLVEVLYYVAPEHRQAAVSECARLLRKGGVLLFAANISGAPYLTRSEVERLLDKAGLIIERHWLERYRLAVRMEGLMLRLNRLCGYVLSDVPPQASQRGRAAALLACLRNPLGRLLARLGMVTATSLVGSLLVVRLLVLIGRLLPIGSPTHVILLAQKR